MLSNTVEIYWEKATIYNSTTCDKIPQDLDAYTSRILVPTHPRILWAYELYAWFNKLDATYIVISTTV